MSDTIGGDLASLPERVAAEFVAQIDAPESSNALIAMIRSGAGGDEAVAHLAPAIRGVLGPLLQAEGDGPAG